MGQQIIIENSTFESSNIINRVHSDAEDAGIVIRGVRLTQTKLVNELDIPQFCSHIQNRTMDLAEKNSMQDILEKQGNKKDFVDALIQHLASFTEGVAASIVANYIMR